MQKCLNRCNNSFIFDGNAFNILFILKLTNSLHLLLAISDKIPSVGRVAPLVLYNDVLLLFLYYHLFYLFNYFFFNFYNNRQK